MSVAANLRQCSLFATLSDAQLAPLEPHMQQRHFGAGDVVFRQGDPGNALFVILDGEVKLGVTSPTQQEIILAMLGSGDTFGELALLDGEARSAQATATRSTDTVAVYRKDFLDLIASNPDFSRGVLAALAHVIRQTNEKLADVAMLDVHRRVAKVLLALADKHGKPHADGILIDRPVTDAEVAAMAGLYPAEVERLMRNFQYDDLIRKQDGKLVLRRPEAFGVA